MKLKYYLRGLGIGIVGTTLILSIAFYQKREMSDAEIIKRATELGMVKEYEEGVLSDTEAEKEVTTETEEEDKTLEENKDETVVQKTETAEEEAVEAEATDPKDDEQNEKDQKVEETSEKEVEKKDDKQEVTKAEPEKEEVKKEETKTEETKKPNEGELIGITVSSGDGSNTVASKLMEAGLIEDAVNFDKYLCRNGYDKRITTGTHNIPMGADEQTIAQIITSKAN